ncbi:hypothetical protein ABW19_dt0208602 [Dactylella cylindrospora]|nr:hypothetical protein ABW19_dt0208602 [Dactylella cylindrospora]
MVRLSTAAVALLYGLSNILSVVAQEDTTTVSDPVLDGSVVVGYPEVNITAILLAAEDELGVNGTVTSTLPPEAGEPATSSGISARHVEHIRALRKRDLKSIFGAIACAAIKLLFSSKVALPGSSNYAAWNNPSFWSSRTYMQPSCVFRPTSAEEISVVVRLMLWTQNDFGIVGGGHSALKGWGNAEDGVLIILAGLTGVKFKTGSAVVPTGERWGSVFTQMDNKNVMALGGRMSTVGVPGLVLGGGISYLSNKYGFVCDQVKSFEIVLSNGCITTASASENADLFRALKGGTSNFGVVTAVELYTWPSPGVYSGQLTFTDQSDFPALFDAVYNYHTVGALQDTSTHLISAFVYVGAYQMHLGAFTAFRNVSTADAGPALQEILAVNPSVTASSTLQVRKYGTQAIELGSGDVSGLRQDMRDFSVYANKQLYKDCWDIWAKYIDPFKSVSGFMGTIAFQPITKTAVAAGVARGGNSLGLEANTATMAIINLTHQWADASQDAAIIAALDKALAECIAKAKSYNAYHPYFYLNYALPANDPIKSYGTTSVNRLKAASRYYDPYKMFQDQVPGGFKIPF